VIKELCPGVLTIAEESTAWANVTSFNDGGLGFDMKWNMGWMNDTLSYVGTDPYFRKFSHAKITFSMVYAFSEKYLLPVSHDEVVHGKKSLIGRMYGEYDDKFAQDRTYLAYMMTHPGKKLLFAGCEIGQFSEWNFAGETEWFLLDYDKHKKLRDCVAELNNLYLAHPALWEEEQSWDGFEWLLADDSENSVLCYLRKSRGKETLAVVLNFTPVTRKDFVIGAPRECVWELVFNTDSTDFGGKGVRCPLKVKTEKLKCGEKINSLKLTVPGHSAQIYKVDEAVSLPGAE